MLSSTLHACYATGIPRKTIHGIEGGTTLTSFRNVVNMKTPIVIAQKACLFPEFQRT
jgi:hypothetical protein